MLTTLALLVPVLAALPEVSAEARVKASQWDELLVEWTRVDPGTLPDARRLAVGAALLAGCREFAGSDEVMAYSFGDLAARFDPRPDTLLCLHRSAHATGQSLAAEEALRLGVERHPTDGRFALLLARELGPSQPRAAIELARRVPRGSASRPEAERLIASLQAQHSGREAAKAEAIAMQRKLDQAQRVAASSTSTSAARGPDKPRAYDAAPETLSPDALGALLDSSRGKPTLAFLYTSWCPACRKALPDLNRVAEQYGPQGLNVVGVSVDDHVAPLRNYLEGLGPRFRPLHVPSNEVVDELARRGIKYRGAIPYIAILDAKGKPVQQGHLRADLLDGAIQALLSDH